MRASALALGLFLLVGACGGGGEGTDPGPGDGDPQTLSGDYTFVFVRGIGATRLVATSWGVGIADGVSSFAGTTTDNVAGSTGSAAPVSFTYTVDADATLRFLAGGTEQFRGGVTANGNYALLSGVITGTPALIILVRRSGTFTAADLMGTYALSSLTVDTSSGTTVVSMYGEASFDGVNAVSGAMSRSVNAEGTIISDLGIGGTYTVAANGAATMTLGLPDYEGGLSPSGELAVFGGDTDTGGSAPPTIWAFAQRGAGLSNASWSGDYWFAGITLDVSVPNFTTFAGSLTADGNGNVSYSGTENDETTVSAFARTGTYATAADGTTVLNEAGATENFQGGITPSGNVLVFAGGDSNGSRPIFWIAFRK